jgi:hypothetical protein
MLQAFAQAVILQLIRPLQDMPAGLIFPAFPPLAIIHPTACHGKTECAKNPGGPFHWVSTTR